jgi:HKD family nuclease
MIEFSLHPNVYMTGQHPGIRNMLEEIWVRSHRSGDGTIFIVSGFANFNGGARFYTTLQDHTNNGGRIVAFFGGSTSQNLTSKQVVKALLECGAEVNVVSRKRILHAKFYGAQTETDETLVVSSANFTGPGMAQNIEASLMLRGDALKQSQFTWNNLMNEIQKQNWLIYRPSLANLNHPAWTLLYDESPGRIIIDESDELTLIVLLGHHDTARIQAAPGTNAGKGTQYFWLSKDSFGFFPPLTIKNKRGFKRTLSAYINLRYVELGIVDPKTLVTFEAENNFDFRLGTGKLRYTGLAQAQDLACISRVGEDVYELRIVHSRSPEYNILLPYATTFIGHRGKRYGYIDNQQFENIMAIQLGRP